MEEKLRGADRSIQPSSTITHSCQEISKMARRLTFAGKRATMRPVKRTLARVITYGFVFYFILSAFCGNNAMANSQIGRIPLVCPQERSALEIEVCPHSTTLCTSGAPANLLPVSAAANTTIKSLKSTERVSGSPGKPDKQEFPLIGTRGSCCFPYQVDGVSIPVVKSSLTL